MVDRQVRSGVSRAKHGRRDAGKPDPTRTCAHRHRHPLGGWILSSFGTGPDSYPHQPTTFPHAGGVLDPQPAINDRAVEILIALTERGHHRGPSPPDVLIAAAAAERSALTLLHVDNDFELIAEVTDHAVQRLVLGIFSVTTVSSTRSTMTTWCPRGAAGPPARGGPRILMPRTWVLRPRTSPIRDRPRSPSQTPSTLLLARVRNQAGSPHPDDQDSLCAARPTVMSRLGSCQAQRSAIGCPVNLPGTPPGPIAARRPTNDPPSER